MGRESLVIGSRSLGSAGEKADKKADNKSLITQSPLSSRSGVFMIE